eukprot:m.202385 g.202385  ORF g.202385 m.202385 type:complete len:282 (+) comp18827_c0_seq4:314-1159(+)
MSMNSNRRATVAGGETSKVTSTNTHLGALAGELDTFEFESKKLLAVFQAIAGNLSCVDCARRSPTWASVTLGCMLCLDCSGKHRALGVGCSFVRSVNMDAWTDEQISMMKAGGNLKLSTFMEDHGVSMLHAPVVKYRSPAAELYRRRLKASARGEVPPERLTDSEVQQIVTDNTAHDNRTKPRSKPKWTPDVSSACCEECFAKFTVVRRRHHCRKCGRLLCGKCAPKDNTKPILETGITTSVRHCLKCYVSPKFRDHRANTTVGSMSAPQASQVRSQSASH